MDDSSQMAPPVKSATGGGQELKGKHRTMVELKRLQQESNFFQEELEELENAECVSTLCMELLENVQSNPDPLLPLTKGPANPSWERWFEAPFNSQVSGCLIL